MTNRLVTATDLMDALRRRYKPPEWALIPEVRNAAGFNAKRTADALAAGLWPSRGTELHGFEVKVTRTDWQRELADVAKADAFLLYVDRWWIVAPAGVVDAHELPERWGLLELPNGKARALRCAKEAPRLEPAPLPRTMLAAMLKRASDGDTRRLEAEAARIREAERKRVDDELERLRARAGGPHGQALERLRESVTRFEEESGVKITAGWNAGNIGRAVKYVLEAGLTPGQLRRTADDARRLADQAEALASELEP